MIIQYQIFTSTSDTQLAEKINEALIYGWQPIGGIYITNVSMTPILWAQAMVKYNTEK